MVLSQSDSLSEGIPDSIRRAGNYLLLLFRAEYEQHKRRIAGLDKESAVICLKRQIQAFYVGYASFDCLLYDHEGPLEWWKAVNQNQTGACQPLAV